MGEQALIALAALAGGLLAVATREVLISAPRLAAWLRASVAPLGRASREGYAPSAEEQRRLAMIGSAAIVGVAMLIVGPGAAGSGGGRRPVERRSPGCATQRALPQGG